MLLYGQYRLLIIMFDTIIVFEYCELDNKQNNLFKIIFENPENPSSEEIWDNTITVLYD